MFKITDRTLKGILRRTSTELEPKPRLFNTFKNRLVLGPVTFVGLTVRDSDLRTL